jgi:hypothetical protein
VVSGLAFFNEQYVTLLDLLIAYCDADHNSVQGHDSYCVFDNVNNVSYKYLDAKVDKNVIEVNCVNATLNENQLFVSPVKKKPGSFGAHSNSLNPIIRGLLLVVLIILKD